ncbi:MAG: methyltransferase [Candidatus Competibacterales bacterium]
MLSIAFDSTGAAAALTGLVTGAGCLVALGTAGLLWVQLRTGVAPLPCGTLERRLVVALLTEAGLPPHPRIVELGSGWGDLALTLSRAFPRAHIEAIEWSWLPFAVGRLRTLRRANISPHWGDFFQHPLDRADAVVLYLMQRPMEDLAAKFDRELKPGTPVVTVVFGFHGRSIEAGLPQRAPWQVARYRW